MTRTRFDLIATVLAPELCVTIRKHQLRYFVLEINESFVLSMCECTYLCGCEGARALININNQALA